MDDGEPQIIEEPNEGNGPEQSFEDFIRAGDISLGSLESAADRSLNLTRSLVNRQLSFLKTSEVPWFWSRNLSINQL